MDYARDFGTNQSRDIDYDLHWLIYEYQHTNWSHASVSCAHSAFSNIFLFLFLNDIVILLNVKTFRL